MKNRCGIWFEEERSRWRVRLYKERKVVHLSYHPTFEEAEQVADKARQKRDELLPQPEIRFASNVGDILNTLREVTNTPRKLA